MGFFFTYKLAREYFQTVRLPAHYFAPEGCQAARRRLERDWLLLLDRGADVDMCVSTGTTALIAATSKGHKDLVSLLLDRGANVNVVGNDTTALIAAVQGGHKDIVSLLLDRGADVNVLSRGTWNKTTALIRLRRNAIRILCRCYWIVAPM